MTRIGRSSPQRVLVLLLIVVLLSTLLLSCVDSGVVGEYSTETTRTYIGEDITRVIDFEAGVVCWIYDGYEGDSISCLPLSDTQLDLAVP